MTANVKDIENLPEWVPSAVRLYLHHTEAGRSLRDIARDEGVHASTVLRQVRRFENRRDDPLVDCALGRLRAGVPGEDPAAASRPAPQGIRAGAGQLDDPTLESEALRILRRLAEPGAVLAVAKDMERAVVLREGAGESVRLAVLDRPVAEAFALREWIACQQVGRVSRYEITNAGRAALRALLGGESLDRRRDDAADDTERRTRPVTIETPVMTLARRRDRDGKPFLSADLVAAAERLREDFEVAQMGPRITMEWDHLAIGRPKATSRGAAAPATAGSGAARDRVAAALRELGPGLADMALRCCCHLEGLETAERKLGWSARSGKIVLRIALLRLKRHYDDLGERGKLLG